MPKIYDVYIQFIVYIYIVRKYKERHVLFSCEERLSLRPTLPIHAAEEESDANGAPAQDELVDSLGKYA